MTATLTTATPNVLESNKNSTRGTKCRNTERERIPRNAIEVEPLIRP